jgi:hypothetical protein
LDPVVWAQQFKEVKKLPFFWQIIKEEKYLSIPDIVGVMRDGIVGKNILACNCFRLPRYEITHLFELNHI